MCVATIAVFGVCLTTLLYVFLCLFVYLVLLLGGFLCTWSAGILFFVACFDTSHLRICSSSSPPFFFLFSSAQVSDRVPFLADLKPSGKYVMEDLQGVGGIPAVLKMLMEEGLIDGSCMTVTGK